MKNLLYLLLFFSSLGLQAQDWTIIGNMESGVGDLLGDEKSNRLYVVGAFDSINGKYMRGVAAWDGIQWNELDHGINYDTVPRSWAGAVHHISKYKGKFIIGGDFNRVGYYQRSRNVALWEPSSKKWDTLDWNPDKTVFSVYDAGDTTYVLGTYDSIGGVKSKGASYLYQGKWTNMSPPNGVIIPKVLTPYQGSLYLGGNMNGSIPGVNDLARWDGNKFHPVGHGVDGALGWVNDLVTYKNEIYVGGAFLKATGHTGENIMKWDGNQFYNIGDADRVIFDLAQNNGILYAGGLYNSIGGIVANKIGWFNGSEWKPLGNEPHSGINKIAFLNDTLYAYRQQSTSNGTKHQILRYNKKLPTSVNDKQANSKKINIYPNPVFNNLEIQSLTPYDQINIYDLNGTLFYQGISSKINTTHYSPGVYLLKIISDNKITILKFIKQ